MSGGYAYVLDLDEAMVNAELVDLTPVPREQEAALRKTVAAHAAHTKSTVAAELLADWPAALTRFTAVIPRDFQRVLKATREAQANGEDVDAAVMAAART
jgi:glutamate synthase (NADPH/NADH) large chain